MKAIQQSKYSKTDFTLDIVDIPKPAIGDQDILVKVKVAGLNPLDYKLIEGAFVRFCLTKRPLQLGMNLLGWSRLLALASAILPLATASMRVCPWLIAVPLRTMSLSVPRKRL